MRRPRRHLRAGPDPLRAAGLPPGLRRDRPRPADPPGHGRGPAAAAASSIAEVPRDLETIVHKAIDRDPDHRYQTAAELAEDLRRFLEDRPIRSRRIGEAEKFVRWCRRNPVPAGLLAALVLVFWPGFGVVAWKWREAVAEREAKEEQWSRPTPPRRRPALARDRASGEEKKARDAAERAGRRLYFSLIDRARLEHQAANIAEAEAILDRCEPARARLGMAFPQGPGPRRALHPPRPRRLGRLRRLQPRRQVDRHRRRRQSVLRDPGPGRARHGGRLGRRDRPAGAHPCACTSTWSARSPSAGTAASSPRRASTAPSELHEAATGRLVRTLVAGKRRPAAGAWSDVTRLLALAPDGRRLATSADDHSAVDLGHRHGDVLAPAPRPPEGLLRRPPSAPTADGWRPSPGAIGTGVGGTGLGCRHRGRGRPARAPEGFCCLAISPDSRTLAAGSATVISLLWNLDDGKLRQMLTGHEGWVLGIAFSPDGLYLASAGQDRTVRVWDAESGNSARVIRGHTDIVTSVAFSPDGDRLVTGSQDGTARVWDLTLRR